jgi:2-dehydropantoate 2-reductase
VAGFQNGVVKDEVLAEVFGADRVLGAVTVLGAERRAPAAVTVAGLGTTHFGELGAAPGPRVAAAVAAFTAAGLPVASAADARVLTWTKYAHAVGVFGVSSLTRRPTGELFRRRPLIRAYRALIEEADAVARAEGVRLEDFASLPVASNLTGSADEFADRLLAVPPPPAAPPSYSSMLQDLMAGRPTEVEEIFGDLVRRARRHGLATPRVELVYDLLAPPPG